MNTSYIFSLLLFLTSCASSNTFERIAALWDENGRDSLVLENINHIACFDEYMAYASPKSIIITQDNQKKDIIPLTNVTALLQARNMLAIGTEQGFYMYDPTTRVLTKRQLPAKEPLPFITALALDRMGQIWIATDGFGLFHTTSDTLIRPVATATHMTSLAITADSGVWAGSNIGLFRIFPRGEIKRYYEETSNGIAIPDNIIEHLQCDAHGNLWIFAQTAVSVLRPEDYRGISATGIDEDIDPMNYAFLGSEGNSIVKFFQRPGHKNIWWALSKQGLLALSNIEIDQAPTNGMPDEPMSPKGHVEIVSNFKDRSGKVLATFGLPNDITFDNRGNLWIAANDAVWSITSDVLDSFEQGFLAEK